LKIEVCYQKNKAAIRVNFERKKIESRATLALKTGKFNPVHPMHILLALETIKNGWADQVVLLPKNSGPGKPFLPPFEERLDALQKVASLFSPWLLVSRGKERGSNKEAVGWVKREFNSQGLVWIASDSGKSSRRILEKLRAGFSLEEALAEVTSPSIAKYLYFYYEEDEFVTRLKEANNPHFQLVLMPLQYHPLRFLHSSLVRAGKANCSFALTSEGVEMLVASEILAR